MDYAQAQPGGISYTSDTVKSPGIVDDLHQLAASLTQEIQALADRLTPILRPDYMEAAKEMREPEPVKSSVRSAHDAIARQIQCLAALRSQLEV